MNDARPLAVKTVFYILYFIFYFLFFILYFIPGTWQFHGWPVPFSLFDADDNTLHGPVFLQEPNSVIFPLDSEEKKVKLSCEVKGNPRPTIGFVQCLTALRTITPEPFFCVCHSVMPLEHHKADPKKSQPKTRQLLLRGSSDFFSVSRDRIQGVAGAGPRQV